MSTTTTTQQALQLRPLPPEPWGFRLKRARELQHFSQEHAAERLRDFYVTSEATISRMEALAEAPKTKKRRQLAWALLVSYGVDPSDLGLGVEDRPPMAVARSFFERLFDDLDEGANPEAPRIHALYASGQTCLFDFAA